MKRNKDTYSKCKRLTGGIFIIIVMISTSFGISTIEQLDSAAEFSFAIISLNVDFTDRSQDSDGSIVSWTWDFGDGNTTTEQNPTHSYAAGGTYSVKLTVTDDAGDSAEFTDEVVTIAQICADDEDSDGVPDTDDKCPGTPADTPVNPKGCATKAKKP